MCFHLFSAGSVAVLITLQAVSAESSSGALVRHAAPFKGNVVGSIQIMTGETVSVEGTANISGSLFVPGTPSITLKTDIYYGGTIAGAGAVSPSGYVVTLSSRSTLGHVVTRTDPIALPTVTMPSPPTGTRNVTVKTSATDPGSFSTLKNLTLEKGVGKFTIPGGSYGVFTAKTGTGFVLGIAGSTAPTIYDFQSLVIESGSAVTLLGPVIINLASGIVVNGNVGEPTNPGWLTLNLFSGALTLNSGFTIYGTLNAPNPGSLVTLKSSSQLVGGLACDKLSIESGGSLQLLSATPNRPPSIEWTEPGDHSSFPASANITLRAAAADTDGTIARVEFYSGPDLLGSVTSPPYQYTWANVPAGTYQLSAQAIDNEGAVGSSNPIAISVIAPPVVTSDANATGQVGAPFSYQVTATNSPTIYSAEGLPAGLRLDAATGIISGTPVAPGKTKVSISVTNSGGTTSFSIVLTILATLPYVADFESAEGYAIGSLDGQLAWAVAEGAGSVTATDHASGTQSVELAPNSPAAVLTQTFADAGGETIEFFDLFAKPVAQTDPSTATVIAVEGATFAFRLSGAEGVLQVAAAGGGWTPTTFSTPLDDTQVTQSWIRLTARIDFPHQTWDLYANGKMVAADVPVTTTSNFLSRFSVRGASVAGSRVDTLYAGPINPIFTDTNNNGLDDTWEIAHGLSLAESNRHLSPAGNGVTVVRAYIAGTDPNDFYNGTTPTITIVSGNNQIGAPGEFNALPFDVAVWNPTGTAPLVNAPVAFSVTQGGGALANSNESDAQLLASLGQRTDVDGTAKVYYKQPTDPGVISEITVRAGTAAPLIFQTQNFPQGTDDDGNGIGDEWETKYFGWVGIDPGADEDEDGLTNLEEYQRGTDPTEYYNGQTPEITVISGEGDPDGKLEVKVHKPDGTPYPNAPITFDIPADEGSFAGNPDSTIVHQNLTLRTDATGVARIYLRPVVVQQ